MNEAVSGGRKYFLVLLFLVTGLTILVLLPTSNSRIFGQVGGYYAVKATPKPASSPTAKTGTLTLSPTSGEENVRVTATGDKFPSRDVYQLIFASKPKIVTSGVTNDGGGFIAVFKVPNDAEPGDHTVTATTLDGLTKATAKFTVLARVKTATDAGMTNTAGGGRKLAATGANSTGMNWGGFALIAAGIAALGAALLRGRKRAEPDSS